jgi:hypothetical protein
MLLSFKVFGGIAPRFDPRRLPDTGAQEAINTKLWRGNLQPFRGPLVTHTLPNPGAIKTIYRWGQFLNSPEADTQYWFAWNVDVDCCKGFIADDTGERTYWTGDGVPKKGDSSNLVSYQPYPAQSWQLGVPAPANAPVVSSAVVSRTLTLSDSLTTGVTTGTITGSAPTYSATLRDALAAQASGTPTLDGGSLTDIILEDRTYVYTYLTVWDEESMPSPPSPVVETDTSLDQTILTDAGPSPNVYNINRKRIYRSSVGTSGASAYQLLDTIPLAQLEYTDNKTQEELEDVLPSLDWDMPPDSMRGLCAMQNGIMAAFSVNNLLFSEAFRPHAWPTAYRHALDYNIVGIKSFTTYLVVGTEGNPYIFQGIDPSSMSGMKLELKQACVSKRSMVSVGDGVIYASPDGLVFVSPTGVKNLTEGIFSRDDWQAMQPRFIDGYAQEGRYFGFNTLTGKGFCMDPEAGAFYTLTMVAAAGYQDLKQDQLYLVPNGSHDINKWEGLHGDSPGEFYEFAWTSKIFVLPRATCFSVAQVEAQFYPLVFNLYGDGVLRHTQNVLNEAPFRLPSGYLAKEITIQLGGVSTVNTVYVATSVAELAEA